MKQQLAPTVRKLPRFATGGDVGRDKPVIVGEKGPEVFLPKTAGEIIPNEMVRNLASSSLTSTFSSTSTLERVSALKHFDLKEIFSHESKGGREKLIERLVSSGSMHGFGGFFAKGGDVAADRPIVVGERGPELFIPPSAGRILPNFFSGSNLERAGSAFAESVKTADTGLGQPKGVASDPLYVRSAESTAPHEIPGHQESDYKPPSKFEQIFSTVIGLAGSIAGAVKGFKGPSIDKIGALPLDMSKMSGVTSLLAQPTFGGFREMGGPVAPGYSYIVGEKRTELFTPKVAGTISPRADTGGGGKSARPINLNFNFNAPVSPDAWNRSSGQILAEAAQHLRIAHERNG